MRFLDALAPFEPLEDQRADGRPDTRSFWQRLHDADQSRGESANTLWSHVVKKPDRYITWELSSLWLATSWGFGIDASSDMFGNWIYETKGMGRTHHLSVILNLGPYSLNLWRESTSTGKSAQ